MPKHHRIESILRDDLERAQSRYKIATELFYEVFGSVPDGLPRDDGIKRIELVAAERRRSMELLNKASRRWSDYLVFGSVPPDLADDEPSQTGAKPAKTN